MIYKVVPSVIKKKIRSYSEMLISADNHPICFEESTVKLGSPKMMSVDNETHRSGKWCVIFWCTQCRAQVLVIQWWYDFVCSLTILRINRIYFVQLRSPVASSSSRCGPLSSRIFCVEGCILRSTCKLVITYLQCTLPNIPLGAFNSTPL